jgi:hypothetical protein
VSPAPHMQAMQETGNGKRETGNEERQQVVTQGKPGSTIERLDSDFRLGTNRFPFPLSRFPSFQTRLPDE